MNADLLVDLLLEMDVLNINELKREIRKLGAHVSDPVAQRWFMRAVTFFMVNIDKLLDTPYRAVAEPRAIRGAPGYYEPFPPRDVPYAKPTWHKPAPESDKPFHFKQGTENKEKGTLYLKPEELKLGTHEKTGFAIYACPKCKGKGTLPNGETCAECHGSGRVRRDVRHVGEHPGTEPLFIEVERNPAPKSKGRDVGFFPESLRLVRSLLDEAEPGETPSEEPPPPPDPEGVYTSRLHRPDIQKHIAQSFTPFKPSQAKPLGKTTLGEPPPKERLPSYATGEQEWQHFNPIQVRRREFFQRLTMLVHFFNYKDAIRQQLLDKDGYAAALAEAQAEGEDAVLAFKKEQEDAKKAIELFKFLGGQSPENIEVFRHVMREAEQFGKDIIEKPWLYDRGSKLIAKEGPYKIVKVTSAALARQMSSRPLSPPYKGCATPAWCTKDSRAEGYIRLGPLYFIDKDDQPFVLVHFESNQAKMPDQGAVPSAVAETLLPVLRKNKEFANQIRAKGDAGELHILAHALETA